tara:strand:- start:70 stop:243 length:174 start_codon:yes stop_codon:yes gene_type:complete
MSKIEPRWPSYVPTRVPSDVSQHVGFSSFDAVKSRSPSLLNLTLVIERSWPFKMIGF